MTIIFLIQSSSPRSLRIHDPSDESLSDAIQTVFPMNTEWAFMVWDGVYIPLGYKYDISLLTDDVIWLLEEMALSKQGTRTIHWSSNTFSAIWHTSWDEEVVKVDAQWNCVLGGVRPLLGSSISIEKQAFVSEWKSLLVVVEKALDTAGYTESQLPALAHLRKAIDMTPGNGALYR
ncbi:hypothetical protein [Vitiosangium sp. GDMCC 1.1324]|uniref:hypothetical protein n=1 Tax=Vitiosangium sp. (strain GDMCC 1.1324) TaxID=2138576 RepID=UPI0018EE8858|nr:hypothetical protein [Vitiosangium sp. GDMCC 1.1324]